MGLCGHDAQLWQCNGTPDSCSSKVPVAGMISTPEHLCPVAGLSLLAWQGVLVTHEQILSCVAGQIKLLSHFENVGKMNADDVFLSYLPLAHIFDR